MLTIKQFVVNPVQENCYVLSDESGEAAIIDCGCFDQSEWNKIKGYIHTNGLTVKHLLNTHLHFDHVMGNRFATEDFGIIAKAHKGDLPLYNKLDQQLQMFFGTAFNELSIPQIDTSLKSNDIINFGTHSLQVLCTPGHSAGGVCFYCKEENMLWSGDTLFEGSIGRTDLESGNYATLINSISNTLLPLPDNTRVYPGHGPYTTIGDEKRFNPYF